MTQAPDAAVSRIFTEAKFPLGRLMATPGSLALLTPDETNRALGRHAHGDWGELDTEDKQANDDALEHGGRLFSAYHSTSGAKFWIITEHDRSVTTILLPEEY